MRVFLFLFLVFGSIAVVSRASAQDDAGADSGEIESLDPTMVCIQRCGQTHEMCVSATTFQDCIANEPACADVRPHDAEILAAFCEACGRTTVGCEATDDHPAVSPPTGAVLPSSSAPRHRPTAEERERTALERARDICRRQRGIWDAETIVLMPDGTARTGVCRTPEGAELAQMIRDEHDARVVADMDLDRRIGDERHDRIEADRRFDNRIAIIEDENRARDSRTANMLAHIMCAESHAERLSLARLDRTMRELLEADSGLVHDGYFICNPPLDSPDTHSTRHADEQPSAGGAGAGIHVRFQLLGGMFFTPLHPVLAQINGDVSSLPLSIGFDATVFGPLSHGWYAEGGGGLTYDAPNVPMYATNARVWYHAGLRAFVLPVLSIGLGYLGSDRFRSDLHSVHSFHGGYLDLSLHFRFHMVDRDLRGSDDVTDPAVVATLRGGFGASFRPIVDPAPDGLLQMLIGVEF